MRVQLVHRTELTQGDRTKMYRLLQQYFEGVRWSVFEADLAEKNWVLLIKTDKPHADQLKGFSTIQLYRTWVAGEPVRVVYSGDTIIDPSIWNCSILPRAWISAIKVLYGQIGEAAAATPERLFWLLICSGFRTYRFLPVFWQRFYPHCDRPAPDLAELLEPLAREKFDVAFDPERGVVKLPSPQRLRDRLSGIPDGRKLDQHIAFFAQKNSGYERGDELVCLTEICPENLTRAGLRMWNAELDLEVLPPRAVTVGRSPTLPLESTQFESTQSESTPLETTP